MRSLQIALLLLLPSIAIQAQTGNDEWTPVLKDWSASVNNEFCEYVSGSKKLEGEYFYSSAFINLAEKSGAVKPPTKGEMVNMDNVDINVLRKYLEYNFAKLTCGSDGINFLAEAFKSNNVDLFNDLLEISIIFFDGRQYAYWNYDITRVKTKYGGEGDESFISFLVNSEDMEKGNKWLDMIDRRVVRSMKYIYQTNSRAIAIYLMKNDPEMINRQMQYGPGEKMTFIGYVESLSNDDRRTEWLELLKSDPETLQN